MSGCPDVTSALPFKVANLSQALEEKRLTLVIPHHFETCSWTLRLLEPEIFSEVALYLQPSRPFKFFSKVLTWLTLVVNAHTWKPFVVNAHTWKPFENQVKGFQNHQKCQWKKSLLLPASLQVGVDYLFQNLNSKLFGFINFSGKFCLEVLLGTFVFYSKKVCVRASFGLLLVSPLSFTQIAWHFLCAVTMFAGRLY